jgi:hypothetical protein
MDGFFQVRESMSCRIALLLLGTGNRSASIKLKVQSKYPHGQI